ncbi:hypothetical protein HAX54_024823 [Datura stramonium]|uniref:NADH dehydrogenase [ubiquinone] 1 beta subcomplex subunit 7 n=1 Tax=Datura stramonium TaxID=4076 RepID=A0ABS8S6A3_DATST|nr:hypothetical protein [Datura stramonium]
MEVPGSSKKMIATQAEMVEAKVPLSYRDQCAHLLIPLNKCRQTEFYLPWKCEDERHSYEKCEYELVMERMLQMQKIHSAGDAIAFCVKLLGSLLLFVFKSLKTQGELKIAKASRTPEYCRYC